MDDHLERTDLIKDDGRYGRLSSLRPIFMTKVVDMLDTFRRFTVRAISADLHTFTFTAQNNYYNKEKLPISKIIVRRFVPSNAYCL